MFRFNRRRSFAAHLAVDALELRDTPAVTTVPALTAGHVDMPMQAMTATIDRPMVTALGGITRDQPAIALARPAVLGGSSSTQQNDAAISRQSPPEEGRAFHGAYGTNSPDYDYNGDGVVDAMDFQIYRERAASTNG